MATISRMHRQSPTTPLAGLILTHLLTGKPGTPSNVHLPILGNVKIYAEIRHKAVLPNFVLLASLHHYPSERRIIQENSL